jgi:hypothetical protein
MGSGFSIVIAADDRSLSTETNAARAVDEAQKHAMTAKQ